jgi:hypothetical protein
MNLAELKEKVAGLSLIERLELASYLKSLDQGLKDTVSRRMKNMDEGKKVTQKEVEQLHRELD